MQFKGATAWFAGCGFAECAVPSPSITSDAALRVAVDCLARTVCRGRTLHVAALVAPGGLACCLSARVASHRPLHPSLSVPISRLPEPVRFVRPGYPALPVTIDRLPGSIRVNRPLSATRRIIICRRRSQSLHLRLHRVLESNHPAERSCPTGKDRPRTFTNRHASPFVKIRVNSWTGQERLRLLQDLRACGRDKRVLPAFSQDRKDAPFLSCSSTPLHLYGHSHSPLPQGTAARNRPTNYDVSLLRGRAFFFSCCPRKNPSWRTS